VARSSDDRLLATGDGNGFVTVWDTGTGSRLCELKALPAHAGFPDITALAFLDES
jgi:WD40 repeat protein